MQNKRIELINTYCGRRRTILLKRKTDENSIEVTLGQFSACFRHLNYVTMLNLVCIVLEILGIDLNILFNVHENKIKKRTQ